MKPHLGNNYKCQSFYNFGFASNFPLRFFLSILILAGLVIHSTFVFSAGEATIIIEGSGIWNHPDFTDHQTSEAKILIQIPQKDGPIEGRGAWSMVGKTNHPYLGTYTMEGPVVLKGQLENGFLLFPPPDYYYDGKLMSNPKELEPTIIRIKNEADSEFVQKFTSSEVSGEGRLVYRLLLPTELWEVMVNGGERCTFGDDATAAGLRIKWRMRMEIEIENGKYKNGFGVVTTQDLEPYSHPPGVWVCKPLAGRYPWNGNRFTSMTFTYPKFDVEGSMSGRTVSLSLPDNKYFIVWEAHLNELEAIEAFRGYGGQRAEDRVRGLRQDTIQSELVPLPFFISAVLIDGWSSPEVNMNAESWQRIHVKRIE